MDVMDDTTKCKDSNKKKDLTKDNSLCMFAFFLYETVVEGVLTIVTDEHHRRPAERRQDVDMKKKSKRDVYIKRNTSFIVICKRIKNLIDECKSAVTMHAMGAAITKCCDAAICIKDDYGNQINMIVKTDTITVVDDFEPLDEVCDNIIYYIYHIYYILTLNMISVSLLFIVAT